MEGVWVPHQAWLQMLAPCQLLMCDMGRVHRMENVHSTEGSLSGHRVLTLTSTQQEHC